MGFFIRILLVFTTAVLLALSLRFNPGNVVIFYPPYRIDLSLNLFILATVFVFGLLALLLYTVNITRKMPEKVAAYRRTKSEKIGNKALRDALKAFFEGRFGHAEKAAIRAAELPENSALASLIAARAAHNMGQFERRDAWLAGVEDNQQYKVARLVSTTELLVDAHQSKDALEAVAELNANGTRHIHVLRWALKANQQAKQWTEVLRLVRALDKHHSIHPALSNRLREMAYQDLLKAAATDAESLRRLWSNIPSEDKVKPFVAALAAKGFVSQGLSDEARQIIEKALLQEWDDKLIIAYREAAAQEGSAALLNQIEHVEGWLTKHPNDPELALTMGALCINQKLWGKAEISLSQAVIYANTPTCLREANLRLAQLNERIGQPQKAADYYRACALVQG